MDRILDIPNNVLKKFAYFAIAKFEFDNLHIQGTSSKSDYFMDRWKIKSISEELIFNYLLLTDKQYRQV
jgi:hypothetical protein